MKIKNKIFFSFSAAISILMVLMGVVLYLYIRKTVISDVKSSAAAIADARSEAITRYIEGIKREMKTEAERNIMKTMDKIKIAEDLKNQLKTRTDTYDNLFVSDMDGDYLASNGKSGNIIDREYFQELKNGNKDYVISNPLISKSTGKAMFVLAYSIRDNNGKQIGFIGNNVNLEAITAISQDAKIGKSGYGWICDSTGVMFAHPSEELRMNLKLSEASKFNIEIKEDGVENILKNESGIESIIKDGKIKNLLIFKKIKDTPGWTFGISVPEKEIYENLNWITLILFILIILLISATAVNQY